MAAVLGLTKRQKKKLRTGQILDLTKYINTFTTKFCAQYEISHWQDEVAAECLAKWGLAFNRHPVKMQIPQYAKRVIYNAAIQWEQRWRKENHHKDVADYCNLSSPRPGLGIADLDFSHLSDIECLILELHYGFGRGEGDEVSIIQIARRLGRSETWVRKRHSRALQVLVTQ